MFSSSFPCLFLLLLFLFLIFHFDHMQASSFQGHQSGCLPRQFRDLLLHEMEGYILGAVGDKEMEKRPLSDVFFICSLLSNFIYGSVLTRSVFSV
jgi:ataxia telangiectasia mutated family protein